MSFSFPFFLQLVHKMSRPQEPHRAFLPFGNPFRMISPKGSYLSPKLLDMLNTFEQTLAGRIGKLKPADKEDVLSLSWMRRAMESLSAIHIDIKSLITALELPVCDWNDKWIDVYFDNSVKLLDICNAFSSEISRLKQSHLFLRFALHSLDGSSNQFLDARSSLDEWRKHIDSKHPRLDTCFSVMDDFAQKLDLPKIKNSAKGKVLMRAMYGIRVVTLLVCSVFAATFSSSSKKLMGLQAPETCLWAPAFADLQAFVNTGIRNACSNGRIIVLKELEAIDTGVKNLYPIVQDGVNVNPVEAEALQVWKSELEKSAEYFSEGLHLLSKDIDGFFKIVLTGRNALLSNLRIGGNLSDPVKANKNVGSPVFS